MVLDFAPLVAVPLLMFLSLCVVLLAGCFLVCWTGERAVLKDLAVLVRAFWRPKQ